MKYTPEPWRVDVNAAHNVNMIVSSSGDAVGKSHIAQVLTANPYKVPQEVQDANAARIVACVNACEGLLHPQQWILEAKAIVGKVVDFEHPEMTVCDSRIETLLRFAKERDEFKAQRDVLLQTLNILIRAVDNDVLVFNEGKDFKANACINLARTVIKKATGEL